LAEASWVKLPGIGVFSTPAVKLTLGSGEVGPADVHAVGRVMLAPPASWNAAGSIGSLNFSTRSALPGPPA
jgi:hypothetical protein